MPILAVPGLSAYSCARTREEAVRFRRMGREAVKALELPEDELLILIGDAAVARGVFSPGFPR